MSARHRRIALSVRSGIALALAVVLLAVACWTVVPATTLWTLALAVGVPELAPQALAVALPLTAFAGWLARGRARPVVLALAVLADACLLWPALGAPFAHAAADRALAEARIAAAPVRALVPVDVTRDVPVPLRGGGALALDLYRPRMVGDVPLVVVIYGGAWMFGSRASTASLDRWYAERGFAVAAIDYRHAPAFRFPAQRDDVDDALRAIAAHARGWHVDASRVALFGRSAGAELALIAAERTQPLGVRAVVAYYAPADLTDGWNDPPRPDPANVRSMLTAYLGGAPGASRAAAYRAASPVDGVHRGMPPVLLVMGERDQLVRVKQQRAFAAKLRALGVPTVALELPWANHAFDEVDGLGSGIAHAATRRFLEARLGVSRSAGR